MERHLLFVRSCVQTCAAAAATAGQPPGCGAPQQQRVEGALSPAAGADAALPLPASTRSQGSRVAPGLQDCPRKLVSRPAQGWRAGRGRCPTRRELGTSPASALAEAEERALSPPLHHGEGCPASSCFNHWILAPEHP